MAINPKDKLREYTNRDKTKPYSVEKARLIHSKACRVPFGKYRNRTFESAYKADSEYFERILFQHPMLDFYSDVIKDLRTLNPNNKHRAISTRESQSLFIKEYRMFYKELNYSEMWFRFNHKPKSGEVRIIDKETDKVIFRISRLINRNEFKFPISLPPGKYRLYVYSDGEKLDAQNIRVMEKTSNSYSVVESIRKKLDEFQNRKEMKDWLKKIGYSSRAINRIISQVFDNSFKTHL